MIFEWIQAILHGWMHQTPATQQGVGEQPPMSDPRLTTLRDQIMVLHRLDRGGVIYGADKHRWRIHERLDQPTNIRIEHDLGFPLPPSYRAYLTELGNGGAGPLFGIEPLPLQFTDATLAALQQPFLGIEAVHQRLQDAGIVRHEDGYYENWDRKLQAALLVGTWPIAYEGCGHHSRIVLHGAEAGTILAVESDGGIFSQKADLLDWMIGWLSEHRIVYEALWIRIQACEPVDDVVTVANSRQVASICGVGIGLSGSGNGHRAQAAAAYQKFLDHAAAGVRRKL
jgi:hypothetical protein